MRLKDFAPSWLAGRIKANKLKPSSAHKIASVYDIHIAPVLGALYIDDITPFDIEQWLEQQRTKKYTRVKAPKNTKAKWFSYSENAILGQYRVLRGMLAAATGRYGLRNPCDGVETPSADVYDDNFLTADELRRVLEVIESRSTKWYAAVLLDSSTGLRWGELSALKWEDIDEEQQVIVVRRGNWKGREQASTKTGKPKVVPLLAPVSAALREHRLQMMAAQHPGLKAGWIFPAEHGSLHAGSPLNKVLRKACKAAETDRRITPHGLRHTANDMLRRVATGEVLRAITGHSTERMTHHYSHVDEAEKRDAAKRAFDFVFGQKGVPKGVVKAKTEEVHRLRK